MASIELKGKRIPLIYTVYEMKEIQEEIAPLGKLTNLVTGRNPEDEKDLSNYGSSEQLNAVAKLIRILGNAGLEEAGEEANLTDKKVMRALKPSELVMAISACMDAMNEAMESEIPKKKTEGPVDVTLEEIEKKKEKDG